MSKGAESLSAQRMTKTERKLLVTHEWLVFPNTQNRMVFGIEKWFFLIVTSRWKWWKWYINYTQMISSIYFEKIYSCHESHYCGIIIVVLSTFSKMCIYESPLKIAKKVILGFPREFRRSDVDPACFERVTYLYDPAFTCAHSVVQTPCNYFSHLHSVPSRSLSIRVAKS